MLERNFKKTQRQDFESMGWFFIQLAADGVIPKGFPDTLCLSPTGYSCYVEWKKSEKAEKQSLQEYWNKRLNNMGHDAFFVFPENVMEWRSEVIRKSRTVPYKTRQ